MYQNEKRIGTNCPISTLTFLSNSILTFTKDSLINYKGKKYSVPCKYINQFVTTKQIENNLHIYYNTELIVIHEINNKNINYKDEHYKQLLSFSIKDNNKIEEITKENLDI